MAKIISLHSFKNSKEADKLERSYINDIAKLDKVSLLNEMVKFQEDRSRLGQLTPEMLIRGKILFRALELSADTIALKSLTKAYRRHLELEYLERVKKEIV